MSIINQDSITLDTAKSNDDIPMWTALQQTEAPTRAEEGGLLVYDNTAQQYKRLPDATDPVPYPVVDSSAIAQLVLILAALPSGYATAALQTTGNTSLATLADNLDIALSDLRDAIVGSTPKTIADIVTALGAVVLAAGTAVIGKVGIDQTTPGATNGVVVKDSSGVEKFTAGNPGAVADSAGNTKLDSIISALTGSLATVTHTAVSVTTSTGVALAANSNRKYAAFQNNSAYTQFLKLGVDAVLNEGIRLNANGGSYEMSASAGNLYLGAVNIIGAAAGTNLVTEGV